MPELKRGEAQFLRSCVQRFVESFESGVASVLRRELGGILPAPVRELQNELTVLTRQLDAKSRPVRVHPAHAPLIRRILVDARRSAAQNIEEPLQKVVDPDVNKTLRRAVLPYQELLAASWVKAVAPARIPRITDFLSIHFAEQAAQQDTRLPRRLYDEKFGILEAPSRALTDLAYYRRRCGVRELNLGFAYADIDDFKAVNSQFSEAVVDLRILPRFMETLESWAFARGHAYRFGGDEYVLLLPNADRALCLSLLRELTDRVAARELVRGVRLKLSVGLCVVDPECFLTEREILLSANAAKQVAKAAGKQRIAVTCPPDHERVEVEPS
ncbi:MAG TPA: GGDEF domain-containing protein [Polyangiaceae bacterium]|nr:GGDEF domain-containing protein [Polyangiaceae bacterium]